MSSNRLISIVINTKNSADTLAACLDSVQKLEAEIIIVDMKSSDETLQIARKYTKHVHTYDDVGYVEPARNFAIDKAQTEWILILDSDEQLSPKLLTTITELISSSESADVYRIPRKNLIFEKWIKHTGWWPDYQVRLFRKGSVIWRDTIHSQPTIKGKVADIEAKEELAIYHNNYPTVESYIDRLQRYTTISANTETKPSNYFSEFSPGSRTLAAFRNELTSRLFANDGLKDGDHGVVLALLQSLYQSVIVAKVWQRQGFKTLDHDNSDIMEELDKLSTDIQYWLLQYRVKNSTGLKKLYWKLKLKLRK